MIRKEFQNIAAVLIYFKNYENYNRLFESFELHWNNILLETAFNDKFWQVYFHYIQKVTDPWGKYM